MESQVVENWLEKPYQLGDIQLTFAPEQPITTVGSLLFP
jgi:hypothetical protein